MALSTRTRRTTTLTAAGGAVVALLLGGCSGESVTEGIAEHAIEQSGGGDVDIEIDGDGESFSVETPDGEMSMDFDDEGRGSLNVETEDGSFSSQTGDEIPDDFPAEVFLPDDFEVISSIRQEGDGKTLFIVNGSVDADADEVFEQIVDAYDVEPASQFESSGVGSVNYDDVGGRQLSYTVNVDSADVTTVHVSVAPTQE